MKKKDSSSWSEIKSLDERLAREPDSFCFARLSEIYLKVGLVADALHTARQGVAKHPGYLAGQRALAMACHANGQHDESRVLLEKVTAAVPEDTSAQKLLATLYVESGNIASAVRAYSTLLDFRPDDVQSRKRLEELQAGFSGGPMPVETPAQIPEYAEEDVYELSEDDIVHDEDETSVVEEEPAEPPVAAVPAAEPVAPTVAVAPAAEHHDPLSTLTLAELYEQQGFVAKALAIYRTVLAEDPSNPELQNKVAALEQQGSAEEALPGQFETPDIEEEADQFPFADFEEETLLVETPPMAAPVLEEITIAEPEQFTSAVLEDLSAPVQAEDFSSLAQNQSDTVVGTLDSWLENIRRIKACR